MQWRCILKSFPWNGMFIWFPVVLRKPLFSFIIIFFWNDNKMSLYSEDSARGKNVALKSMHFFHFPRGLGIWYEMCSNGVQSLLSCTIPFRNWNINRNFSKSLKSNDCDTQGLAKSVTFPRNSGYGVFIPKCSHLSKHFFFVNAK